MSFDPPTLIARVLTLVIAFTLHEYAHAWTATRFGDYTAMGAGRLTLNPLSHLDPFGTLMLIVAGFGWAKPVPVDFGKLRRPKQDMLWVAAAGPAANLLMALAWALLFKTVLGFPETLYSEALREMAKVGIGINGV